MISQRLAGVCVCTLYAAFFLVSYGAVDARDVTSTPQVCKDYAAQVKQARQNGQPIPKPPSCDVPVNDCGPEVKSSQYFASAALAQGSSIKGICTEDGACKGVQDCGGKDFQLPKEQVQDSGPDSTQQDQGPSQNLNDLGPQSELKATDAPDSKYQGRLGDEVNNALLGNEPPVGTGKTPDGQTFQSTRSLLGGDKGQALTSQQESLGRSQGLITPNDPFNLRPSPGSGYSVAEKALPGLGSKVYSVWSDLAGNTFMQSGGSAPQTLSPQYQGGSSPFYTTPPSSAAIGQYFSPPTPSLASGGPLTMGEGMSQATSALWESAKATAQEAWDKLASYVAPPDSTFSDAENAFPVAPEATIPIASTDLPSGDGILAGILPSTEDIGLQFADVDPNSMQGKGFVDSVLNKQSAGQMVSEAEAAAATAFAERMHDDAQTAYDNRGTLSRIQDFVGLQSEESIALAEANMRLGALQQGPVQPIDLGGEAVALSPDSTAGDIKFVSAGITGEQLQSAWNGVKNGVSAAYDSVTTPFGKGNPAYDWLNGEGAEGSVLTESQYQARMDPNQGLPGSRIGVPVGSDAANLIAGRGAGPSGVDPATRPGLPGASTGVPVGSDITNPVRGFRGSASGASLDQGLPGGNTGVPVGSRVGAEMNDIAGSVGSQGGARPQSQMGSSANIDARYADPNYRVPAILDSLSQEPRGVAEDQLVLAEQRRQQAYKDAGYVEGNKAYPQGGISGKTLYNPSLEANAAQATELAQETQARQQDFFDARAEAVRAQGRLESTVEHNGWEIRQEQVNENGAIVERPRIASVAQDQRLNELASLQQKAAADNGLSQSDLNRYNGLVDQYNAEQNRMRDALAPVMQGQQDAATKLDGAAKAYEGAYQQLGNKVAELQTQQQKIQSLVVPAEAALQNRLQDYNARLQDSVRIAKDLAYTRQLEADAYRQDAQALRAEVSAKNTARLQGAQVAGRSAQASDYVDVNGDRMPYAEYKSQTDKLIEGYDAAAASAQAKADAYRRGDSTALAAAEAVAKGGADADSQFRQRLIDDAMGQYEQARAQVENGNDGNPEWGFGFSNAEKLDSMKAQIERLASGDAYTAREADVFRQQFAPTADEMAFDRALRDYRDNSPSGFIESLYRPDKVLNHMSYLGNKALGYSPIDEQYQQLFQTDGQRIFDRFQAGLETGVGVAAFTPAGVKVVDGALRGGFALVDAGFTRLTGTSLRPVLAETGTALASGVRNFGASLADTNVGRYLTSDAFSTVAAARVAEDAAYVATLSERATYFSIDAQSALSQGNFSRASAALDNLSSVQTEIAQMGRTMTVEPLRTPIVFDAPRPVPSSVPRVTSEFTNTAGETVRFDSARTITSAERPPQGVVGVTDDFVLTGRQSEAIRDYETAKAIYDAEWKSGPNEASLTPTELRQVKDTVKAAEARIVDEALGRMYEVGVAPSTAGKYRSIEPTAPLTEMRQLGAGELIDDAVIPSSVSDFASQGGGVFQYLNPNSTAGKLVQGGAGLLNVLNVQTAGMAPIRAALVGPEVAITSRMANATPLALRAARSGSTIDAPAISSRFGMGEAIASEARAISPFSVSRTSPLENVYSPTIGNLAQQLPISPLSSSASIADVVANPVIGSVISAALNAPEWLTSPLQPFTYSSSVVRSVLQSPGTIASAVFNNIITTPANSTEVSRRGITATQQQSQVGQKKNIVASFYGDPGDARAGSPITSSGARYDPDGFTIAHRDLRLGTRVLLEDGVHDPVVARVTNRGPFVDGRDVDLSYAGAKHFEFTEQGTKQLQITVLDNPSDSVAYSFGRGRTDFDDGAVISSDSAKTLLSQLIAPSQENPPPNGSSPIQTVVYVPPSIQSSPSNPSLPSMGTANPFSVVTAEALQKAGIPQNLISSNLGKSVTITYEEKPSNRWDASRGSFPKYVANTLAAMGDPNAKYLGSGKLQVSSGPRQILVDAAQRFNAELEKRGLTFNYITLARDDSQNVDAEGNPNSDHKIGFAADGNVTIKACPNGDDACIVHARMLAGNELERNKLILEASAAANIQQLDLYGKQPLVPGDSIHIGMSPFRNGAPGETLGSGIRSEGIRRVGYGDAQVGEIGSLPASAKGYSGMQEAFDVVLRTTPPQEVAALYDAINKGDLNRVAALSKSLNPMPESPQPGLTSGEMIAQNVDLANAPQSGAKTRIVTPTDLKIEQAPRVVVFLRGYSDALSDSQNAAIARAAADLPNQLLGRNAVLIDPDLGTNSNPGVLAETGRFQQFVEEAKVRAAEQAGLPSNALADADVIVVAYSGGGDALKRILSSGTTNIQGILLLDALYGDSDAFADWIKLNPNGFFVSSTIPNTETTSRNTALQRSLGELRDAQGASRVKTALGAGVAKGDVIFLQGRGTAESPHSNYVAQAWVHDPVGDVLQRLNVAPAETPVARKSTPSSIIDDFVDSAANIFFKGGTSGGPGQPATSLSEAVTRPFEALSKTDFSKLAVDPAQLKIPKNDHLQPTSRPVNAPLPVSVANEGIRPRTAAEAEAHADRLIAAVLKKYPNISKQDLAAQLFFKGLGNTPQFKTLQADIATAWAQSRRRSNMTRQDIQDATQVIGQQVAILMMPEGFPTIAPGTEIPRLISFSQKEVTDPLDDYLWELYQRMYYREDSGGVFTFKDPTASIRSGIPLRDIIIAKLPQDFKVHLASAAKEMERAGLVPAFSAIERNPFFRPDPSGNAAKAENSTHGKGLAADFYSAKGLTNEQREDASVEVHEWLEKNAHGYGLARPYSNDEPHVENVANLDELTRTQEAELARGFGTEPQVARNQTSASPIDAVSLNVTLALAARGLVPTESILTRETDGAFTIKTNDGSSFILKPEGENISLEAKKAYTLDELKQINPLGAAFLEEALQKGGQEQLARVNNTDTGPVRISRGASGEIMRRFVQEYPDFSIPKKDQPNVLMLRQNFRGELAASVINLLEQFHAKYGYVPRLSSGIRDNSINNALPNSAENSGHIFGLAADFSNNAELGGFKSTAHGNDFMKMARENGLATNDERGSAAHIHIEAGPRARGQATYSSMDKAAIDPQTAFANEKTQFVLYDARGNITSQSFAIAALSGASRNLDRQFVSPLMYVSMTFSTPFDARISQDRAIPQISRSPSVPAYQPYPGLGGLVGQWSSVLPRNPNVEPRSLAESTAGTAPRNIYPEGSVIPETVASGQTMPVPSQGVQMATAPDPNEVNRRQIEAANRIWREGIGDSRWDPTTLEQRAITAANEIWKENFATPAVEPRGVQEVARVDSNELNRRKIEAMNKVWREGVGDSRWDPTTLEQRAMVAANQVWQDGIGRGSLSVSTEVADAPTAIPPMLPSELAAASEPVSPFKFIVEVPPVPEQKPAIETSLNQQPPTPPQTQPEISPTSQALAIVGELRTASSKLKTASDKLSNLLASYLQNGTRTISSGALRDAITKSASARTELETALTNATKEGVITRAEADTIEALLRPVKLKAEEVENRRNDLVELVSNTPEFIRSTSAWAANLVGKGKKLQDAKAALASMPTQLSEARKNIAALDNEVGSVTDRVFRDAAERASSEAAAKATADAAQKLKAQIAATPVEPLVPLTEPLPDQTFQSSFVMNVIAPEQNLAAREGSPDQTLVAEVGTPDQTIVAEEGKLPVDIPEPTIVVGPSQMKALADLARKAFDGLTRGTNALRNGIASRIPVRVPAGPWNPRNPTTPTPSRSSSSQSGGSQAPTLPAPTQAASTLPTGSSGAEPPLQLSTEGGPAASPPASKSGTSVGSKLSTAGKLCLRWYKSCVALGIAGYFALPDQKEQSSNIAASSQQSSSTKNPAQNTASQKTPTSVVSDTSSKTSDDESTERPSQETAEKKQDDSSGAFNEAVKNTPEGARDENTVVNPNNKDNAPASESGSKDVKTSSTPLDQKDLASQVGQVDSAPDARAAAGDGGSRWSRFFGDDSGSGFVGSSAGGGGGGGFLSGGMNLLSGLLQGLAAWWSGGESQQETPASQPPTSSQPSQPAQKPVGAIVGNPSLIDSGTTTRLSWSSVGTDAGNSTCAVITADFAVYQRGKQNGTITSPVLTESTRFGLICDVNNAKDKLLNETLVRVHGDDTDPPRIFSDEQIAASQASSANASGSTATSGTGITAGASGGQSLSGQGGNPTPEDVRTCDPEQPMDSFIRCLCEAEPNPNGCTIPPGGLRQ